MGKRIYWTVLILITALGLGIMFYYGQQPRPQAVVKLSHFENPGALAESIEVALQEEIRKSPVIFLGVEPDHPEHFAIWKEFLHRNQQPGMKYDELVIEQFLETPDFPEAQKLQTKEEFDVFKTGIQNLLQQGKRVAVIVPTIYSVQMIPGNLVQNLIQQIQSPVLSLSLTDFPRHRELEKNLLHPCVVEGVDQTGLGPFGCLVLQTARSNYRQQFKAGDWVGLVQQINPSDYVVLYTQEK